MVDQLVGTGARLFRNLLAAVDKVRKEHPETRTRSNAPNGKLLLEAYLWDTVVMIAKGKSEDAWAKLEAHNIYTAPNATVPGAIDCGESPKFLICGKVTEPVARFSGDRFAELLNVSKYKVPQHFTKELIQKAKVGVKGNVSVSIIERGMQ